jgi:hypothetical protein
LAENRDLNIVRLKNGLDDLAQSALARSFFRRRDIEYQAPSD